MLQLERMCQCFDHYTFNRFFCLTTILRTMLFHEKYYSQESGSNNVVFMQLDLASQKSIRSFAETFLKTEKRLDILINNAGLVEFCTTPFSSMFTVCRI